MSEFVIRLFGPFSANWTDGLTVEISSTKQRALLALLATAPEGVRTRAWLQDTLWSLSGPEHGRASLRRALSDLRGTFNQRFDDLFTVTNLDIRLNTSTYKVVGEPSDGEFLEGVVLHEPGFNTWLEERRRTTSPILLRQESLRSTDSQNGSRISPSVAVIPFIDARAQSATNPLGDLFAQEITRTLSRSKVFDVISHLSCRQFQQSAIDLQSVKDALGIDYLVYGNLFLEDDRLRVDADLVDARSGKISWTQDFSGNLSSFLNRDKELVTGIARQIARTIISSSTEYAACNPLPTVESHALFMSAITLMHRHRLKDFSTARVQLEELIRRHPHNSLLHAWLAKWYILSISQGWSTDAAGDNAIAAGCTGRALDINPSCSFSLAIDGMIQNDSSRDFEAASSRFENALDIDPNNSMAWLLKSRIHSFVGDGPAAVDCANRACSLSPVDPHRYFYDCLAATAFLANNEFEQALSLANRSFDSNRRHASTARVRTIALELSGRSEEARVAAEQLLSLEPNLTIDRYLKNHPAADFQTGISWAKALRQAGIPNN